MPFMDMIFPKKSPTEDLLPGGKGKKKEEDLEGSVQELYGLRAPVPRPAAYTSGPQSPRTTPVANPAAGSVAPSAQPPTQTPPPGGPAPTAKAAPEPLDTPLRDLFTETTAMDPQLEALLRRVDRISAKDLVKELRAFARSIGAESANRR